MTTTCCCQLTPGGQRGQRMHHRQGGISLVVCLVMLLATLLLGVSAAQIALQGEKAARGDRDYQIALQAAEAGLMDAELDIENSPDPSISRSALFAGGGAEGFIAGCGAGLANPHLGLCSQPAEGMPPAWTSIDFLDESANARSVPYGRFTGQSFQAGQGPLPAKVPRYVIELMPYNRAGEDATKGGRTYLYRITSMGFGMRDTTQVVLQTVYRKEDR
ncbi:pilus assembly PilX family protein [Noviherbaspirillum massiliense]|uniref:pilus assembly PilX family protein n=1 Tax=Noviherbaspirillum massiliense TaxID=1465823 RepID=UPI001FDF84B0|nr:PilX N-terminal domain-containing pilus assembly protein [Noviherbaspirillum massiliense]